MTATTATATRTIAESVIERLELHHVSHIFGIPGTHNLPFYDAIGRSRITHIAPRHEQGGAYAADGFARASGKPGVCLTTSGPGLTNALTAIATAHSDSVPVLLLAPGMPDPVTGHDTAHLHELRDQFGLIDRLVGRAVRAHTPDQAIRAIDEAFASFRNARPRPFYLEVPLDVLDLAAASPKTAPISFGPPTPDPALLDAAARLLAQSERPALLLGGGARTAAAEALELAHSLAAAVATTVNGKGVVPEDDPRSLGSSIRLRCVQRFLADADVLLVVGSELGESDLWRMPPLRSNGQVIRIDIDPRQLHKNASASVAIAGDARIVLQEVNQRLTPSDRALPDLTELRREMAAEAAADGAQYAALVSAIEAALEPDAIIASDSTMACYYGLVHFRNQRGPGQLLYPTGYATLGYGTPAAIGAKLALPDRQVMAVMGDGGVMFTLQEVATAVEQGLSIPIIVVHNGGYGEIRRGMVARGMEPLAVDFAAPDFCTLAAGFGARAARAGSYVEIPDLLTKAFKHDGPTIIEVWEEKP